MELQSLIPHNNNSKFSKINEKGQFGIQDVMNDGFQCVKSSLDSAHPLERCEKEYHSHQQQINYTILKSVQGLHAPLRLKFENKMAAKIQRLPFLPSSNLMLNTLNGTNLTFNFEDVFCDPSFSETLVTPFMMIEKNMRIMQ